MRETLIYFAMETDLTYIKTGSILHCTASSDGTPIASLEVLPRNL
jgi:hypothetical protein